MESRRVAAGGEVDEEGTGHVILPQRLYQT